MKKRRLGLAPAKSGAIRMTWDAAAQFAPCGIRSTAVVPRVIKSPAFGEIDHRVFAAMHFGGFVADAGDYYPFWRDGPIDALERGTAESRWAADPRDAHPCKCTAGTIL